MKNSHWLVTILVAVAAAYLLGAQAEAQRGGPPAPISPRAGAPVDITGQWVSLITEDWRYRQFTPPKGDYGSLPLLPPARKIADSWDPARDEAAGEQCKAYGAAGLLRLPTRLRINWNDEATLKLETDAGTQTRLFQFGSTRAERRAATGREYRPPRGTTHRRPSLLVEADGRQAAHSKS
jgi:hypothetical protein